MQQILSRQYAQRLIAAGRAREEGVLKPDQRGDQYVIISRLDTSKTAHYLALQADIRRLAD